MAVLAAALALAATGAALQLRVPSVALEPRLLDSWVDSLEASGVPAIEQALLQTFSAQQRKAVLTKAHAGIVTASGGGSTVSSSASATRSVRHPSLIHSHPNASSGIRHHGSVAFLGNPTATLQQFQGLSALLADIHGNPEVHVHELQHAGARKAIRDMLMLAKALPISGSGVQDPLPPAAAVADVLQRVSDQLAKLPVQYGHPILRRVAVGTLLKLHLAMRQQQEQQRRQVPGDGYPAQHGSAGSEAAPSASSGASFLAPEVRVLAHRVLLQLFALHRRSLALRGMVQFFHISKSGGTNLCMAAGRNNCSTEDFSDAINCMIGDFSDSPRWVSLAAHRSMQHALAEVDPGLRHSGAWFVNFERVRKYNNGCTQRKEKMRYRGYDFYANEFTLPSHEAWLCGEFVNLMLWRHPWDRLHSQIAWIQKLYKDRFLRRMPQAQVAQALARLFSGRDSSFWNRLLPAAVNNYYIRSLLGPQYFHPRVAAITKDDVTRAKMQVLLHDLLLVLESRELNDATLRVGLGWRVGLNSSNIRSSMSLRSKLSTPVDYATLREHNQPDVEVYEFSRHMAALDLVLWRFVSIAQDKAGLPLTALDSAPWSSVDTTALSLPPPPPWPSPLPPAAEVALEAEAGEVGRSRPGPRPTGCGYVNAERWPGYAY